MSRSRAIAQLAWLEKMRDYISASDTVDREHLEADNVLARENI
jgi:hypothetical protein